MRGRPAQASACGPERPRERVRQLTYAFIEPTAASFCLVNSGVSVPRSHDRAGQAKGPVEGQPRARLKEAVST